MAHCIITYEDKDLGDIYEEVYGPLEEVVTKAKKDGRPFTVRVWRTDRRYPMFVPVLIDEKTGKVYIEGE